MTREQTVTQVYSSAISVGYDTGCNSWETVARLVLEANYEAVLWVSIIQFIKAELLERESEVR